jgi:hypothetical protein
MKRRAVAFAMTFGMSVFVLGGATAAANESDHSAIRCALGGPPGQDFQTFGSAGPNRFATPPEVAALFGFPTVGAGIDFFCVTPPENP